MCRRCSPRLEDGHLLPVSSRDLPSVCICVLSPNPYKDIGPIALEPMLMASLYLHSPFKDPVCKYSCILEQLGVKTSMYEFGVTIHITQ